MDVLLINLQSIEQGKEFAIQVDEPAVWSKLALAQMNTGLNGISDAIECFIRADDDNHYSKVIPLAEQKEL
jgi:clathrin heavy chain